MKNTKRLFSLVLAVVMLFSLVACGNQDNEETTPSTNPQSESVPATTVPNELAWLNTDGGFPIVKEGTEKTLSIYVEQTAEYGDPEESWFFRYIEEEMNINLDITTYTGDNKKEFLSLAFASDELPDIIIGANFSTAELLNYGELEEQLLDLAPYINETYMPNLYGIYQEYPELKTLVTSPAGNVWSLGRITSNAPRGGNQRFFINYEWLEQCGLEVPTTLDEFINAMRTFKAEGLCEYPIGGAFASEHPGIYILNAMGYVGANAKAYAICLRDGKAVMPLADREVFGEYLKVMNQLYEEGLIHPDFFTMDRTSIYAVFAEDVGFMAQAPFACTTNYTQYWCAPPLTSQWNDTAAIPTGNGGTIGGVIVSAECEEPELAAKFIDAFYSTDLDNVYRKSILGPAAADADILYGMVSGYEFDENGVLFHADYENNKDAYTNSNDYLYKNVAMWNAGAFGYDSWARDLSSPQYVGEPDASTYEDPSVLRADPVVSSDGNKHYEYAMQTVLTPYATNEKFPGIVYLDAELSAELANLLPALRSYAEPEIAKFITGARPLTDEELDDYFTNLEALGSIEYVKAYQDYLDSIQ
jgi:putative aldouronate transport system substrate-binding protein